jgi:hypothetical protein
MFMKTPTMTKTSNFILLTLVLFISSCNLVINPSKQKVTITTANEIQWFMRISLRLAKGITKK